MKPSTLQFSSPLSRRLAISIILVSSIITLVLTAIQLYGTYRQELNDIDVELSQIKQTHVKALSESLWAANLQELSLQLEGLVQTPYIEYAAIHEGDKLWYEAGAQLSSNHILQRFALTTRYRNNDTEIGSLTVLADLDKVYGRLVDEAVGVILRNGLKTFLVAAFMLWFFHQQVNRFLIRITTHLSRLDLQARPEPLSLHRKERRQNDEFDLLSGVINRMQEDIYQAHKDIRDSNLRFHAIADYTIDWENWFAADGRLLWVNPSVTRVTGYTPEECYLMKDFPLPIVSNQQDTDKLHEALSSARRQGSEENLEFEIQHKDGRLLSMAISWQPIFGADDTFNGFRASVRDITYLKRVLQVTRQEKARMTSLLGAMALGILFEDTQNRVVYVNPAFRRIWLIAEESELTNQMTINVLEQASPMFSRPDQFSSHVLQVLDTHEMSESFEIPMSDGRVVTQCSYPVRDQEGLYIGRLWVYEDVTYERQTAAQLIYLAERDSLTGLYNRHRFQEELSRMLADCERRATEGALLFFDLDEFKHINDSFGHRAGDSVLTRIAGDVKDLVRKNEIISRIGGDEFAVLLPESGQDEAIKLSERIIRTIAQIPFSFGGQNLRLTCSLGIALYPGHGDNVEDLVAHADTAMYLAKDAGKNAWRVYDASQDASMEMLRRMGWSERIGNALERGLFELHFQGIYHAADKKLCHLEALIRMRDESNPSRIIMPGHFIPVAEQTGRILDIDRWVICESIHLLEQYPALPAIAINISGRSFDDPQLPQYIQQQLARHQVEPSRLMVELTETAAVSDVQDAQRFIECLHKTGCQVCLDDFGSGFASFAYLKYLKVDILKIDGLFIRDLSCDRDNQVFVKSIVDVARGLNKRTVAEFVEDARTLELLKQFGVDLVQGYHLDKPQADHLALHKLENA